MLKETHLCVLLLPGPSDDAPPCERSRWRSQISRGNAAVMSAACDQALRWCEAPKDGFERNQPFKVELKTRFLLILSSSGCSGSKSWVTFIVGPLLLEWPEAPRPWTSRCEELASSTFNHTASGERTKPWSAHQQCPRLYSTTEQKNVTFFKDLQNFDRFQSK